MPTSPRVAVVVVTALLLTVLSAAPVHADGGSAPVTAPDRVTAVAGLTKTADLVGNDSDPDGDDLAVCRLGPLPRGLQATIGDPATGDRGSVILFGRGPGTYTVTYYACDFTYLTAGTLTVTLTKPPEVRVSVHKLARPGRLRVANRSGFPVVFAWGSTGEDEPDGVVTVKGRPVVVHVRRRSLVWYASARRYPTLDRGVVRGIRLPRGVEELPPGAPSARDEALVAGRTPTRPWR